MENKLETIDIAINIAEIHYINMMKEFYDTSNMSAYEIRKILFPSNWESISDKSMKLKALQEALSTSHILTETETINDFYRKKYTSR